MCDRKRDLPADRAAGGDSEHCRSASMMCFESKKLDRLSGLVFWLFFIERQIARLGIVPWPDNNSGP